MLEWHLTATEGTFDEHAMTDRSGRTQPSTNKKNGASRLRFLLQVHCLLVLVRDHFLNDRRQDQLHGETHLGAGTTRVLRRDMKEFGIMFSR